MTQILISDDSLTFGAPRKVLGSHSEVSRDSTKQTKMIAEQKKYFLARLCLLFLHNFIEGHI